MRAGGSPPGALPADLYVCGLPRGLRRQATQASRWMNVCVSLAVYLLSCVEFLLAVNTGRQVGLVLL